MKPPSTTQSPTPGASGSAAHAPLQEAFVALVRAADRVMAEHARLFREHGISEPQYNVLRILRGAGTDGLSCQQIGQRMITRVPDVTRLLDRLESVELVARERNVSDRRVVITRLAPKGRVLLQQLDLPVLALHAKQLGHLDKKELNHLVALLGKVMERISDTESGPAGRGAPRRPTT